MADSIRAVTMPKWGIEMSEGTITAWSAGEGQQLQKGEALLEVETDKIVNAVEAPFTGTLRRIVAQSGETKPVGALIAVLDEGTASNAQIDAFIASFKGAETSFASDAGPAKAAAPAASAPPPAVASTGSDQNISPVAKKLADTLGVDISKVQGSGRNGRISKEDIEAHAARMGLGEAGGVASAKSSGPGVKAPEPDSDANPLTRIKMSSTRSVIARRLLESKQSIPHYRLAIEVDVNALMARKRELAAQSRVTINDLTVRACALALVKHPALNATLEGEEIVRRTHADIAVAVATDDGLITPIVRRADTKSVVQIAQEIAGLAERSRRSALTREEITGGSFTISNLGMYKLDRFDAIINPPQVAILAVGAASEKVVARNGAPVISQTMVLTLSADHRVVDGAVAAAFLVTLRELLEGPAKL